jgi:phage head maturation protease
LNHDWDNPIGAPVAARTDPAQGLFVQAEIVPTEAGETARVLLAHKVSSGRPVIQSLSFGFRELAGIDCRDAAPVLSHWASVGYTPDAEDLATLHAACARGGVRIITDVQLFEVSPVTVPGQLRAAITAARAQTPKPRDFRLALALALADLTS